jgi:hypothetical protein
MLSLAWWCTPVILGTRRRRSGESEFKASLSKKVSKIHLHQKTNKTRRGGTHVLSKQQVKHNHGSGIVILDHYPGSWTSLDTKARPYLKNNYSKKGWGAWLKWERTCLASTRSRVQTPFCQKKKKPKTTPKQNK